MRIPGSATLGLALVFIGAACSSAPSEPKDRVILERKSDQQVNAEFDGKCAMAVANGDFSKLGSLNYRVDYDGKTYLFANAKAKEDFIRNLGENANRANGNWSKFQQAHGTRHDPGMN